MENTIFTITLEGSLLSELAEQMEDKLADWLAKQGLSGVIHDSTTGNDTVFEFKPSELPVRRFNPQPKPEKRR